MSIEAKTKVLEAELKRLSREREYARVAWVNARFKSHKKNFAVRIKGLDSEIEALNAKILALREDV